MMILTGITVWFSMKQNPCCLPSDSKVVNYLYKLAYIELWFKLIFLTGLCITVTKGDLKFGVFSNTR